MAEQANLNIDPNAPAPTAGNTAVPAAAAPVVAAAPKPKNRPVQQQQQAHKKGVIEIPQAAFKARVQREAAALIKSQTGKTMEEAIAIVKAGGGVVPAGGGQSAAANTAAQAMSQLQADNAKLRKANERLTRESEQSKKHFEKKLRNERDARVEAELMAEARIAGITDPDYAVTLFARAVGKDATLQPSAFFAGLKKTKPALFEVEATHAAAAAPATATVPDTAPPESTAAGEVRPQPTGAGGPPKEPNAEEMSPAEFSAHQRRYGFVPGQA
jgi:hypothetical protein